mgnify:CR=1 FL=1
MAPNDPIIAKKHLIKTGTFRCIELRYLNVDDLEFRKPPSLDGVIYIFVAKYSYQKDKIIQKLQCTHFHKNEKTLVVVDDSPASGNLSHVDNNKSQKISDKIDYVEGALNWRIVTSPAPPPTIGGKGFLVHEYASHVRAKLVFSHYQVAWNEFNK